MHPGVRMATAAVVGGVWSSMALALDIQPIYVNGAGQTWTTTYRGVVEQAIADWESKIINNGIVQVTFDFTTGGGYLGQWSGVRSGSVGTDLYPWSSQVSHAIHVNVDYLNSNPGYLWFDPTPTTSNDQPFYGWDALSVVRHELGHALGFTSGFYYDNVNQPDQFDKWTSHITGSTFDPGGMNVLLQSTSDVAHIRATGAYTNDLMTPSLANNVRHGISAVDLDMLHLAYGYTLSQSPMYLIGDTPNFDGTVNFTDLNNVLSNYGKSGTFPMAGDTTTTGMLAGFDNHVNFTDLNMVLSNYGHAMAGAATVPEPAGAAVLALGGMLMSRRNRRP